MGRLLDIYAAVEDDFPEHEDDVAADRRMEEGFEHAQDEYEARHVDD